MGTHCKRLVNMNMNTLLYISQNERGHTVIHWLDYLPHHFLPDDAENV